jgi:[ribosomal protein S5]-alanine N-acetyltransferase
MTLAVLDTTRLLLRQLKETDVSAIYSLRSNEQVNRFIDRPTAKDPKEAKAFIQKILENKSYYWGITLKENGKMIGTICLWNESADRKSAELGYELHPDCQGKGYMDEAMKEVIGFAFRSGFTSLEAQSHKDNFGSTKLLLKHGFVYDEERKDPENPYIMIFSLAKPAG